MLNLFLKMNEKERILDELKRVESYLDATNLLCKFDLESYPELKTLATILTITYSTENVCTPNPFKPWLVNQESRSPSIEDIDKEKQNLIESHIQGFYPIIQAILYDILYVINKHHHFAKSAIESFLVYFDGMEKYHKDINRSNFVWKGIFLKRIAYLISKIKDKEKGSRFIAVVNRFLDDSKPDGLRYNLCEALTKLFHLYREEFIGEKNDFIEKLKSYIKEQPRNITEPRMWQLVREYYFRLNELTGEWDEIKEALITETLDILQMYEQRFDLEKIIEDDEVRSRKKIIQEPQILIHWYEDAVNFLREIAAKSEIINPLIMRRHEIFRKYGEYCFASYRTEVSMSRIETLEPFLEKIAIMPTSHSLVMAYHFLFPPIDQVEGLKPQSSDFRDLMVSTTKYIDPLTGRKVDGNKDLVNYLTMFMSLASVVGKEVIQFLKNKNDFLKEFFGFFIDLPHEQKEITIFSSREYILDALWKGFCGDYIGFLHIAIPQVESLLKEVAQCYGVTITTQRNDDYEKLKMLETLLENLKDVLNEKLRFYLEKMLTKKGLNIRNNIAHGFKDENAVLFAPVVFFLFIELCFERTQILNKRLEK